jgi:hypothetical protein
MGKEVIVDKFLASWPTVEGQDVRTNMSHRFQSQLLVKMQEFWKADAECNNYSLHLTRSNEASSTCILTANMAPCFVILYEQNKPASFYFIATGYMITNSKEQSPV